MTTHPSTSWHHKATCRQGHVAGLFYPTSGDYASIRKAKQICVDCPVRERCLEAALAERPSDDWGIWGGTTRKERARIRRAETIHPHTTVDGTPCRARRHGNQWAYRDCGCRCPDAVDAWHTYNRASQQRYRNRHPHRTGRPRGPRPLFGYDPANVVRACAGQQVVLSVAEIRAAVARLHSWGLTGRQIATRLHTSTRTVDRYRAQLRARPERAEAA